MTRQIAHARRRGPSHRAVEIGVALAMSLFGAIVIIGSLQVGIGWGAEGPKAGFFPFYIGCRSDRRRSLVNLVARAHADRDEVFADWGQLRQVLSVVIPTAIYVVAGAVHRHLRRVGRC